MRVTLLSQYCLPEPGAGRVIPFAQWLQRHGHSVEAVTAFPNYPEGRLYPGYRMRPYQRERVEGVDVLRLPILPTHDRSAVRRFTTYASFALSAAAIGLPLARRSDLTYVVNLPTVGLVAMLRRALAGTPFVFNIPDLWPDSVLESGMVPPGPVLRAVGATLRQVNRAVFSAAAGITVISEGFRKVLLEQGVPEQKVHTVYNWIDEHLFQPVPRDENLARELGFVGKTNFVFAGAFGAFQGLDTLLRAADRIRERKDIQIVLIGTGTEEASLKRMKDELRLENVLILPRRPMEQMPALNAISDVLLVHLRDLPFFSHTIPSKTQVALASGRPILMGVRGEAGEIIERAGAGVACTPEDPGAMADRILQLAAMPVGERERMGERGRTFYQREMSLEAGAGKMFSIFESIVSARPPRSSAA